MPEPLAFLNGRFLSAAALTLGVADAGFVFAATATDFCRTYRRKLFRWSDHLARLRRDCAALHISLPYSDLELTAAAEHLVAHNAEGELAVVTFATPGPLGHMLGLAESGPPTVAMHTFPLPVHRYRRFFSEGVTLAVVGQHSSGSLVPVAAKHRSRLHWWLAERAVTEPGGVPVLFDEHGVADTAIGSVLAVFDDRVIRPEPGTVLEGVSLTVVEELCAKLGLLFEARRLDYRDPVGATEVLLAGSGFGLAGVRRMVRPNGVTEFTWPGPVLKRLLAAWSEMAGVNVEEIA